MFTTLKGDKFEKTAEVCGIGTYAVVNPVVSAVPRLNLTAVKRLYVETSTTGTSVASEVDICNVMKDHPNCIKLIDVATRAKSIMVSPRLHELHEGLTVDEFYPVFEKETMSLHNAIHNLTFSLDDLRKLMFQMASSLHFSHMQNIMHRDVKSNNFLYSDGRIKLCDFGAAKRYHKNDVSTPRILHPLFRAPEIFLHLNYDFKVDVWSLGCLFIYMLTKEYMFVEAIDEPDDNKILNEILCLLPYNIDVETYNTMLKDNPYFSLLSETAPMFRKSWKEILSVTDENLIELIASMMQFNPNNRFTMKEVLASKFFTSCPPILSPKIKSRNFLLKINSNLERAQFITKLFPMHIKFSSSNWYNPRILFFALDIFDRVLINASENIETNPAISYRDSLKSDGKIFPRKIVSFFVYSCMYFAFKYFYINKVQIQWSSFCINKFPDQSYINFEKMLFYLTSYSFYRLNLYESLPDLTSEQLKELMHFIAFSTCSPGETFYSYLNRAREYIQ